MEICEIELKEIRPYENNAKKHDTRQISNVAESIKQFGFVQPIVIDKNNEIVIGHCRYESAKKLNMKKVPCIYVENLSKSQVKKLRNLDNKLNESQWDYDLLNLDIEDLSFEGFDIDWEIPDFQFEENSDYLKEQSTINLDDYQSNKKQVECPKCGFKFEVL